MSDEAALLAAIYANHDEDTPRLVYADWLDEHDRHEEAELIRLPLELARLEYYSWPWVHVRDRGTEIQSKFRDRWLAYLDAEGKKRVRLWFDRGLLERVSIERGTPEDYRGLRSLPGVREVCITDSVLTEEAMRDIATFEQLDMLSIWRTPFQEEWLDLLVSLPPWTSVEIGERGESSSFDRAWDVFQQQRIAGLANAPTERLRQVYRRRLGNDHHPRDERPPPGPIHRGGLAEYEDFDLVALSRIPELEELRLSNGYESEGGLRHLTRLPKLRSLEFRDPRVNPIAVLAVCTQLERVHLTAENGPLTDEDTDGLERLTSLQDLLLDCGPSVLRDGTFRHLAPLKQLRALDLHFGALKEGSFSVLAGLSKLEILKLAGPTRDSDLRDLAGLTKLMCLALTECDVTDAGLDHLAGLTKLRTLLMRGEQSHATEVAARRLAARLPDVTILLDHSVIRTPKTALVFQRCLVGNCASLLCPITWAPPADRDGYHRFWVVEDGWENISGLDDGRSANIVCYDYGHAPTQSAAEELEEHAKDDHRTNAHVTEQSVASFAGVDHASCIIREDECQELLCKISLPDNRVTLICRVTPSRFEEFRSLFLFVARSLRIGSAALEGVGEEVTVPVSQL